jgi:hypothetical protein
MENNIELHACITQAIAQLEQAEYILLCEQLEEQRVTGAPLRDSQEMQSVKQIHMDLKVLRSSF